jgi:hypothetical protein
MVKSLAESVLDQQNIESSAKSVLTVKELKVDWDRTFDVCRRTEMRMKQDVKAEVVAIQNITSPDDIKRIEYAGEWSNTYYQGEKDF